MLFEDTKDQKLTKDGFEFDSKVGLDIAKVYQKYIDEGYSLRDIEYFINTTNVTTATKFRLMLRCKE